MGALIVKATETQNQMNVSNILEKCIPSESTQLHSNGEWKKVRVPQKYYVIKILLSSFR